VRIRALGGNPAGRPPYSEASAKSQSTEVLEKQQPEIGVKILNTLRFLVIFALICGIALGLI
jgi:hypothetical protein